MEENHIAFLWSYISYQEQVNKNKLIGPFKMAVQALETLNTPEADKALLAIALDLGYEQDKDN